MTRLATEIRSGTVVHGEELEILEQLPNHLGEIPHFVIDNVAEYAHTADERGRVIVDPAQFPNLAPPFEIWWMEYHGAEGDQTGAWLSASRFDDPMIDWGEEGINAYRQGDRDAAWLLSARLYGRVGGEQHIFYAGQTFSTLSEDGSERRTAIIPSPWFISESGPRHTVDAELRYVLYPFYVALSFLHCRNVIQQEHLPNRGERRRAQRDGTLPPVSFKTLVIEPMRRVLESEGGAGGVGIAKALHICRGHFRSYDERPMFGKLKGTYFVPAHLRGRAPRVVMKQYEVRAESSVEEVLRKSQDSTQPPR